MVLKHINSPMTPDYMKYLLEHDTVHGRFSGTCEIKGDGLVINGMDVSLSATRDPTEIPWAKTGVEYVCESTGAFTTTGLAPIVKVVNEKFGIKQGLMTTVHA